MNENNDLSVNTKKADFQEMNAEKLCKTLIQDFKNTRQKKEISLRGLESISGIHESNIARMESGRIIPNLKTLIKLLAPMGKTLYIGNVKPSGNSENGNEHPEQLSIF